jgi:hypothetical protein
MNRVVSSAVVAGLVLTLGGAVSWAGPAPNNDPSDNVLRNTAGGTSALQSSSLIGIENTAFGYWALLDNTSGSDNTAFGDGALVDNQDGSSNTAIGAGALEFSTRGNFNTASGAFALYSNTSGDNTADGYGALYSNTSGTFNTASGAGALSLNTAGGNNTATGYNALSSNTDGSYNTALGYQALYNSTGSKNLALGYNAGYKLSSGDRNIYVGHSGMAKESNTIRLGQAPNQTHTFIAGIYGVAVGNGSPKPVYINSNGQLGTSTQVITSSARYKRDIRDMRERSQGLYHLRPVTFRYKQDEQGVRQYGLIAEEVVKVYPELVTKGADGKKVEGVEYEELIPMLLNEVQHQQQKLAAQSQELAALKAQAQQVAELKAQNAALAARLDRLEQEAPRTATAATP